MRPYPGHGALPALVQFPHPGGEHRPATDAMPWSDTNPHKRKFLLADGRWQEHDRRTGEGVVTFWGEWEPPSQVIDRRQHPIAPGFPHVLHRPLWARWEGPGWRQNTDPLVFGGFSYSNCRQAHNARLRSLAPGSILLFGSRAAGRFVLDTCLVVANGADYRCDSLPPRTTARERNLVFDPLFSDPTVEAATFRHYRGATIDHPINGTFSFVPGRPYSDRSPWGFGRPAIELGPELINPRLAQAAKATLLEPPRLSECWRQVVDQVLDSGLVLVTQIDLPSRRKAAKAGTSHPAAPRTC